MPMLGLGHSARGTGHILVGEVQCSRECQMWDFFHLTGPFTALRTLALMHPVDLRLALGLVEPFQARLHHPPVRHPDIRHTRKPVPYHTCSLSRALLSPSAAASAR